MTAELHNDVGHGKNTYPPNKGVTGLPEFEFNSAVGREVKNLLNGIVPTYEAQPFNGYDIPLITRTNNYNARWEKNKDAIGISNHANANKNPDIRGFGVFYWHSSPEAKKLAEMLLDEYKKEFPNRDQYPIWGTGLFASKPDSWTDLHMCRETDGVFVLVEWEFMTNPVSLRLLKSDDYRKRCALVNARTVCRWYGIPFMKEPKPVTAAKELKKGEDIMSQPFAPSNSAIMNSVAVVLKRFEQKDPALSQMWRDKFLKNEMTISDAIGLLYVAVDRGYIQGIPKE